MLYSIYQLIHKLINITKLLKLLNKTHSDSSALGMIAEDVLQIAPVFSYLKLNFGPRLCNGIAHYLAKFALSFNNALVWTKKPPNLIQELLLQDICNPH